MMFCFDRVLHKNNEKPLLNSVEMSYDFVLFMENHFTSASKKLYQKSEINCCCTSLKSVPSAIGKGA